MAKNIEMNYYNGNGYEVVYPKTNLANVTGSLNVSSLTGVLPINKGGTGATTLVQARQNLGIQDINVDEIKGLSSYLTLVGNANVNMVNAALGQNNEDIIKGVGFALARYMKYKDSSISVNTIFSNLIICNTLDDILNNVNAQWEIARYYTLWDYLFGNNYAKSKLFETAVSVSITSSEGATKTGNLEITSDHLNGNKVAVLFAKSSNSEPSKEMDTQIKFNNVFIANGQKAVSNRYILDRDVLASFNITTPGSYPIYVKADSNNNSYPTTVSVNVYSII